jgi:hypothetical protein
MNAISKVAKMILALVPPVAGAALIAAPCHAIRACPAWGPGSIPPKENSYVDQ